MPHIPNLATKIDFAPFDDYRGKVFCNITIHYNGPKLPCGAKLTFSRNHDLGRKMKTLHRTQAKFKNYHVQRTWQLPIQNPISFVTCEIDKP